MCPADIGSDAVASRLVNEINGMASIVELVRRLQMSVEAEAGRLLASTKRRITHGEPKMNSMTRNIGSVRSSAVGSVFCLLLTFGTVGLATPEQPADAREVVNSMRVSYADLDLTTEAGVGALYGRLRNAAQHACGGRPDRTLRRLAHWRACYEASIDRAVAQIDRPALASYHRARSEARAEG
jgi:UrcA family protein